MTEAPPTPTWVKVIGIVIIVLVIVFGALHLTGRGLGGHMPHVENGTQQP